MRLISTILSLRPPRCLFKRHQGAILPGSAVLNRLDVDGHLNPRQRLLHSGFNPANYLMRPFHAEAPRHQ